MPTTKIKKSQKPIWMKFKDKEIEAIVLKLANKGMRPEKIGLVLRDSYGIPTAKIHKKISKILEKENKLSKPSSLANLEKKLEKLKEHFNKNKQDKKAKYTIIAIQGKISKLKKHYKKRRKNV